MKKKVIITPWGSDIHYISYFKKLIFKLIFNNNYFTTDSFEIKNILHNFSESNKVYKINFGIDVNYYKKDFKKIFFSKKKIILCPRGYEKVYNADLILHFIKLNKGYLMNYKFLFLGNVNKKKRILNLALDLGVKRFCYFLKIGKSYPRRRASSGCNFIVTKKSFMRMPNSQVAVIVK